MEKHSSPVLLTAVQQVIYQLDQIHLFVYNHAYIYIIKTQQLPLINFSQDLLSALISPKTIAEMISKQLRITIQVLRFTSSYMYI